MLRGSTTDARDLVERLPLIEPFVSGLNTEMEEPDRETYVCFR